MVTYKSRPRSINQQFNFQGSTGLIARFGRVERGRRGWGVEVGGRKGQRSESENNRRINFSQILPERRHYWVVVATETEGRQKEERERESRREEDREGTEREGGEWRREGWQHLGFSPSPLSVC